MIYMTREDYYNIPVFNSKYSNLMRLASDDTLYKSLKPTLSSEQLEFLNYLRALEPIDGLVKPADLVKDDEGIYAYTMPFIRDCQNISEYLENPKVDINVRETIKRMDFILRKIHAYIIIGDIRNTNILLSNGSLINFVDVAEGKKVNDPKYLITYYSVIANKNILDSNRLSDLFKAFICSLSLYYDIDLEKYFRNRDLKELLALLKDTRADSNLIYYLEQLITCSTRKKDDCDLPLFELMDYVALPSEEEKLAFTRKLPRPLY